MGKKDGDLVRRLTAGIVLAARSISITQHLFQGWGHASVQEHVLCMQELGSSPALQSSPNSTPREHEHLAGCAPKHKTYSTWNALPNSPLQLLPTLQNHILALPTGLFLSTYPLSATTPLCLPGIVFFSHATNTG